MAVVDVPVVNVVRRTEDLHRNPGYLGERELPDREDVEPAFQGRVRRHPQPPSLVIGVGIGPSDHHGKARRWLAVVHGDRKVRTTARVAE